MLHFAGISHTLATCASVQSCQVLRDAIRKQPRPCGTPEYTPSRTELPAQTILDGLLSDPAYQLP